ncbi:recombination mediator RecR [Campylobacter geochelonis]|uniref:Recombination protein RecR n=1 Tax=Campylobacter geochelonis TaxID=1780362 RepID=A0A128EH96_9BACT|nr:recombination mediator RecR [Campylobacter geochelonis]QKF70883.1 recombination protein [Campylobacter geochelonis]CZE47957.1 recombination protein RecR [Campylobacter geochelonis]CZE48884.1 recombination protein RecR [Campylobacter geochelonis]CZE51377.1 recombination protein RecR [Campylobacter geochelonis]
MRQGISKFDDLVACFEKLPGVGKKSALKYAYHVSLVDSFSGLNLAHSIEDAVSFLKRCQKCGALSENEICDICADLDRDRSLICLVESPKDLLVLEQSKVYNGLYFVLDDVNNEIVEKLRLAIKENGTSEVIFALTPGINSDGIMLYIEDKLQDFNLHFSKIAQGIPTGVSLDNVDMLSLMKAMSSRMDT